MTRVTDGDLDQMPDRLPDSAPADAGRDNIALRVLQIPARRWLTTLVCVIACGAAAFVGGKQLAEESWTLEAGMQYNPLVPTGESGPKASSFPPFSTLITRIKSQPLLEKIVKEFKLDLGADTLEKLIKVSQPVAADNYTVTVTLGWGKGEDGAAILNRLVNLFRAEVAEERKAWLKEQIKGLEDGIRKADKDIEQTKEKYRRALEEARVTRELTEEIKDVHLSIELKKATLEEKKRTLKGCEAAIQDYERPSTGTDAKDPTGELRVKREEIKTQIETKRLDIEQLEKELRRQESLGTAEPRAAVDKTRNELRKAIRDLRGLEAKLKEIEEVMKTGGGLSQTEVNRKNQIRDLESKRAGLRKEIEQLTQEIEETQKRAKELLDLQRKLKTIDDDLARFAKKKDAQTAQKDSLETLQNQTDSLHEFTVTAVAVPRPNAVSSNRTKTTVVLFALPLGLCLAALGLAEMARSSWRLETLLGRTRLPVLAKFPGAANAPTSGTSTALNPAAAGAVRALALRIRQCVPETGGVILVTPLTRVGTTDDLVCDLSHYLGIRDEKVLVIDTRLGGVEPGVAGGGDETGQPVRLNSRLAPTKFRQNEATTGDLAMGVEPVSTGLVEYLVFENMEPEAFLYKTAIRSVDYLPAGGPSDLTDALASQLMRDLLTRVREVYSVIFLLGPPITARVETEILAAYAQGIVLYLEGDLPMSMAAIEEPIVSLKEINAPLLGVVVSA